MKSGSEHLAASLRWGAGLLLCSVVVACGSPEPPRALGQLAWDRVELTAEVSEPIVSIPVNEGARVGPGDLLVALDPRRADTQAKQASAAKRQAKARLAEVERGTRNERITQARAQLAGAEAAFEEAEQNLDRVRALGAQNLVSREVVDSARADRDRAVAERNRLRAQLAELEHGATNEELLQARAALAQAEAAEKAAAITLERLTVRAPRAGRIDALPFEVGERPAAGAVVAVLLVGESPYARIYVPEPVRAQIAPGTAAHVHVDGIERPFSGKVRRISSDPVFTPFFSLTEYDRKHLSYLAEVVLDGTPDLAAGVPVEVVFESGSQ